MNPPGYVVCPVTHETLRRDGMTGCVVLGINIRAVGSPKWRMRYDAAMRDTGVHGA